MEGMAIALELATHATSTIAASKEMLLRLRAFRTPPAGSADDIIARCYGSDNFKEGVAAFREGRPPVFGNRNHEGRKQTKGTKT